LTSGDSFLLVASDRISAFDVIHAERDSAARGEVLTQVLRISGSRNFPRWCQIIFSAKAE